MAKKIDLPYLGKGSETVVKTAVPGGEHSIQSVFLPRERADLEAIVRKFLSNDGQVRLKSASRQGLWTGLKQHPFNYTSADIFKGFNVHHSTCIEAKVMATVGLGFVRQPIMEPTPAKPATPQVAPLQPNPTLGKPGAPGHPGSPAVPAGEQPKTDPATGKPELETRSEVSRVLDPFCRTTFQAVLTRMAYDQAEKGVGFIEVTRDDSGAIAGLHHVPANACYVVVDDEFGNFHYEVTGLSNGGPWSTIFAAFGDRDGLFARASQNQGYVMGITGAIRLNPSLSSRRRGRPPKSSSRAQNRVSEIIQFDLDSPVDRHYGYPEYLSATIRLELVQCLHRHTFDFFLNRGVPEYILAVMGAKINAKDWSALTEQMKGHIGLGNAHKSMQLNIPEAEAKVELHKLALEGKTDGLFSELDEALSLGIVSAHGVPPLLAGIQIPGKLGATNELPNALMAFQALKVGPRQEQIETMLQNTLGVELGLDDKELKLRSCLEVIDVKNADTVGRMRTPLAAAGNRDLSAGVLKSDDDRLDRMERMLYDVVSKMASPSTPPPIQVTLNQPAGSVNVQPPSPVVIPAPQVTVGGSTVNLPAPLVTTNVEKADPQIVVNVAAPNVTNQVPAPTVNVAAPNVSVSPQINMPKPGNKTFTFSEDAHGNITGDLVQE